jgi:hypothetical protein
MWGNMNESRALPQDFLKTLNDLEELFLRETDPIRQSGFGGGAERWRRERGAILEAINESGSLLDVGCANGFLLECMVQWAGQKGIALVPFGLDQGSRLIELARRRMPQREKYFWTGNAWDWVPPRRFRYVYTLTDCVPSPFLRDYLHRLLELFVEEGGRLIVGAYGSMSRQEPAQDVTALLTSLGFRVSGTATAGDLPTSHVAWVSR